MTPTDPIRLQTDADDDRAGSPPRRVLIVAMIAYALLTLVPIFHEPITRVQESRVLETSRQMLDAPDWRGWLVPQLNGEPRLRKPPLCYWYTAGAFRLFGTVEPWAGRVPALLLAWATIAVTYRFGRDLGGRRMGYFAAAGLATGTLFLRFTRTDETDVPAALGVLIAFRAIVAAGRADAPARRSIAQCHVAALGIALAAMGKGGPATFPVAFLILTAVADRSWRPIVGFLRSGAPLTALALIVPWFAYVALAPGAGQVGEEVKVVLSGSNHFGLFYEYFLPLAAAAVPWTGWLALALIAAWMTRKTPDRARRVALLAIAGVGVPLSFALNVQRHYLVPILPMVALLAAWFLVRVAPAAEDDGDGGATIDPRLAEASRWVMAITTIAIAAAAPGVLVAELVTRKALLWPAALASAALAASAAWLIVGYRHATPRRQLAAFAAAMLVAMPSAVGFAEPIMKPEPLPDTAAAARAALRAHFGGAEPGPYLMADEETSVTLGYYLRSPMRAANDPAMMRDFVARHPRGVVIVESSRKRPPTTRPVMPPGLVRVYAGDTDVGETAEFYARDAAADDVAVALSVARHRCFPASAARPITPSARGPMADDRSASTDGRAERWPRPRRRTPRRRNCW